MPKTRVNVNVSGPMFDGRFDKAVRDWIDVTKKDLATDAQDFITAKAETFNRSGRGTGYYATQIQRTTLAPYNDQRVHDGGVVYGPWLEGVSKRNNSTRFKGYHAFRKARTRARAIWADLAQRKLTEYIDRMGGHIE